MVALRLVYALYKPSYTNQPGRLCLLWYLNVRASPVLPMPRQRGREIRHCLPWYFTVLTEAHLMAVLTAAGAPFDTGTSYRPGARFGPNGIRQGSRRLNL